MVYQMISTGFIRRVSDGAYIPPDTGNVDYQEYLRWVADGNTAAAPSVIVPEEVTAWQAKHALLATGLFSIVEAAINAMQGDEGISARIDWNTAPTFKRAWPLIEVVRIMLGKTSEEIDQLFILAGSL